MRRIALVISAAIFAVFLLASALFLSQGRFGGGHERFDFILYLLAVVRQNSVRVEGLDFPSS